MQVAAGIYQRNLKLWHSNWTYTSRCSAHKQVSFFRVKKSFFFFTLTLFNYYWNFFFYVFFYSLSHWSAMPRSFLVRSKRCLHPSRTRLSYMKQWQLEADSILPVTGEERRSPGHEVSLQTPSVPVSHGPQNWDWTGSWPHAAQTHLCWPSGTQELD